ncbi:MAG: hypothetical protein ABR600_01815 [Actinomycetota bacterium]
MLLLTCSILTGLLATGPAASAARFPAAGEPLSAATRVLRDLGAPSLLPTSPIDGGEGRYFPYTTPIGDLDGDGAPDVVSLSAEGSPRATVVLTARRGLDGSQLFRYDTGESGGVELLRSALVGPTGSPGLILATYPTYAATGVGFVGTYSEQPFGYESEGVVGLNLTSLRGDGTVAWQRSFDPGAFAYTGESLAVAHAVPVLVGTLAATSSPATDLAVAVYNRTPGKDGQDDTIHISTIDGSDGRDAGTVDLDIDAASATVRVAPDLDRDGLSDLTVAVSPATSQASSPTPQVLALRGRDEATLWRSPRLTDLTLWSQASSVGDATGDGVPDLVVNEADPQTHAALLDGATGSLLFDRPADVDRALGDVDGDGRADVLLVTWDSLADASGVTYRAVAGDGTVHYERSYQLKGGLVQQSPSLASLGDVDGDGVSDFSHHLTVSQPPNALLSEDRVVSGRTGNTIRLGAPGLGLGTSLDGSGDDVAFVSPFGRAVFDVTAADGRTGADLSTTRIRPRGDMTVQTDLRAADVTGDGTPDLVLNVWSDRDPVVDFFVGVAYDGDPSFFIDTYVLDGRTGALVWSTSPPRLPRQPDLRGTATPGTPFSWSGTPSTGLNQQYLGNSLCSNDKATSRCEDVLVRVDAAPEPGASTAARAFTATLDQFGPVPEPATDLDLFVYQSDELGTVGPLIGQSTNGGVDPFDPTKTAGEKVTFPFTTTAAQPTRFYVVRVVYYQSVSSGYHGAVSIG